MSKPLSQTVGMTHSLLRRQISSLAEMKETSWWNFSRETMTLLLRNMKCRDREMILLKRPPLRKRDFTTR